MKKLFGFYQERGCKLSYPSVAMFLQLFSIGKEQKDPCENCEKRNGCKAVKIDKNALNQALCLEQEEKNIEKFNKPFQN